MTKKIAQLTKVIFHLNSRNEENDTYVAQLKAAHAKEMELVVQDAKARLDSLELMLSNSISRATHEEAISLLAQTHNNEKALLLSEAHKRHQANEAKQEQLKETFEKTILQRTDELKRVKDGFSARTAAHEALVVEQQAKLRAAQQESQQFGRAEMEKLEAQIMALNAQHEEERRRIREEMQADTARLLDEKKRQFAEDIGKLKAGSQETLRLRLQEAQNEWENERLNLQTMFNTNQQVLLAQHEELKRQLAMGSSEANNEISRLKTELENAKSVISDRDSQLMNADNRLKGMIDQSASLSLLVSSLKQSSADLAGQLAIKAKAVDDLDSYSKRQEATIEAHVSEIQRLNETIRSIQSESQRVSSAAKSLSTERSKLTTELEKAQQQFDQQVRAMEQAREREERRMRSEFDRTLATAAAQHESEKSAMIEKYQSAIEEERRSAESSAQKSFEVCFVMLLTIVMHGHRRSEIFAVSSMWFLRNFQPAWSALVRAKHKRVRRYTISNSSNRQVCIVGRTCKRFS
jgi:hypothetical protein